MAKAKIIPDGHTGFFDKNGTELFIGSIVRFTSTHPESDMWKFGEVWLSEGICNNPIKISLCHTDYDHAAYAPFFWEQDGEWCWDLEVVTDADMPEYLEYMESIDGFWFH